MPASDAAKEKVVEAGVQVYSPMLFLRRLPS